MENQLLQLLVLGGVAVFLILKLRSVLGTREGFEKPPVVPASAPTVRARPLEVVENGPDRDISDHVADGLPAAKALAAMKLVEPKFNVTAFLGGARGAYEMILLAFEEGDLDRIRQFLSPEVAESFAEAIAARHANGLTVDAEFIGMRELALHDATFDRGTNLAEISVRFVGELTTVVKNAAGEVVEGSATEIKRQRDVWTFARTMGSADPNWQLVATGD